MSIRSARTRRTVTYSQQLWNELLACRGRTFHNPVDCHSLDMYTVATCSNSIMHCQPFRILSLRLLSLPLRPARPLVEDDLFPVVQDGLLPLVNALQPVAEAGARTGEDGVCPERAPVEEGSHLEAELPDSDGDTCGSEGEVREVGSAVAEEVEHGKVLLSSRHCSHKARLVHGVQGGGWTGSNLPKPDQKRTL